jgi:hypothetical protein
MESILPKRVLFSLPVSQVVLLVLPSGSGAAASEPKYDNTRINDARCWSKNTHIEASENIEKASGRTAAWERMRTLGAGRVYRHPSRRLLGYDSAIADNFLYFPLRTWKAYPSIESRPLYPHQFCAIYRAKILR